MTATAQRFWGKVRRGPVADCWPWTAARFRHGYGMFSWSSRLGRTWPAYAHRVAWELTHGEIPAGLSVLHRCDNRSCVNPAHLFLGSQGDNMRDAAAKGRLHQQGGVR